MKNSKLLSLILILCLLLQLAVVPVRGAETTLPEQTTLPAATTPTTQGLLAAEELDFGEACVKNGCRTIEGMVPLDGSDRKLSSAQAAFLFETTTETVVYAYNPDVKLSPGSLAKLVTGMIVLQNSSLDEMVTVTGDVHRRPAGSIHAGLKTDEEISVKDLIHCLLLESANDAAIALAVHVAGNRSTFVNMMNQWVASIGCTNTEFASVHGLDDTSMTSARDMARIMIAATENETMMEILGTLDYVVEATNKNEERSFRTGNYMIDKGNIQDMYNDVRIQYDLDGNEETPRPVANISKAMATVVSNIAHIRNEYTDAHARTRVHADISKAEARFTVNASVSVCQYLIDILRDGSLPKRTHRLF